MKRYKINFDSPKLFDPKNFSQLMGVCGLYFIFLEKREISYPFGKSRLIYIGMSEKRTNSIGNRLMEHYEGRSGNIGIVNYKKVEKILFTYINFEMLKGIWQYRIEDLESYFILDFVEKYGVYPICNNKTGFEIQRKELNFRLDINWKFFENGGSHE
jgi:hypothetical protein